jgi:hypothetical protein
MSHLRQEFLFAQQVDTTFANSQLQADEHLVVFETPWPLSQAVHLLWLRRPFGAD